ncbi:MAG: FadR/GntR family transcriptional regulator [Sciscionella sp.]
MTSASETSDVSLFEPIRQQRAFESVLEQLEGRILDGRLQPGDRLPNERLLSETLEVSRPSLREALRVLEAMDIITVRTGVGAAAGSVINDQPGPMVARLLRLYLALGHFTVPNVVQVRHLLEGWALREAAQYRTPEHLEHLRSLLVEMDSHDQDTESYFTLDALFHVAIADATGNPLLAHLMAALRDAIARQMVIGTVERGDWASVVAWSTDDHRAMVAAIADQDPDAAEAALEHHLSFYRTEPTTPPLHPVPRAGDAWRRCV